MVVRKEAVCWCPTAAEEKVGENLFLSSSMRPAAAPPQFFADKAASLQPPRRRP
jgi:hypothetical protein